MPLIKALTTLIQNRVVRFLLVGVANTLFGFFIFALSLNLLKLNYAIALAATYVLGITFNFFSVGYIVFDAVRFRSFLPFIFVYLGIYCINYALLRFLSTNGIGALKAQALLLIPMALMTFFLLRRVFGKYGKS